MIRCTPYILSYAARATRFGPCYSRGVIHLREFMPGALAEALRRAPLSPEKVAFAWRMAVGPSVDRVTSVQLAGHVLRVRAKDAAWRREVERSSGVIRSRLDALLGKAVVTSIDITTY
jgi:hypothetical protein